MIAYSINSLLDFLDMNDEIFVVGETANKIANLLMANSKETKRNSSKRNIAVVIVDRVRFCN